VKILQPQQVALLKSFFEFSRQLRGVFRANPKGN
jgi:hypothetical protein